MKYTGGHSRQIQTCSEYARPWGKTPGSNSRACTHRHTYIHIKIHTSPTDTYSDKENTAQAMGRAASTSVVTHTAEGILRSPKGRPSHLKVYM